MVRRHDLNKSERSAFSKVEDIKDELLFIRTNIRTRGINHALKDSALVSLSTGLVGIYSKCNPDFRMANNIPHRILTNPSEPGTNNSYDNVEGNLICRVNDKIESGQKSFVILDILGTGTFGQVFRSQNQQTKEIVAIKVVKNKTAYYNQGLLEVKIVTLLNSKYDPNDERHIVRLMDSFVYKGHVCQIFELLSFSLLEILTQNQFRGLPLAAVQRFTRQILDALIVLEDANVVHCDL